MKTPVIPSVRSLVIIAGLALGAALAGPGAAVAATPTAPAIQLKMAVTPKDKMAVKPPVRKGGNVQSQTASNGRGSMSVTTTYSDITYTIAVADNNAVPAKEVEIKYIIYVEKKSTKDDRTVTTYETVTGSAKVDVPATGKTDVETGIVTEIKTEVKGNMPGIKTVATKQTVLGEYAEAWINGGKVAEFESTRDLKSKMDKMDKK